MTLNELIENKGEMEYITDRWGLRSKKEIKEHLAKYGIFEDLNGQLVTTEERENETA